MILSYHPSFADFRPKPSTRQVLTLFWYSWVKLHSFWPELNEIFWCPCLGILPPPPVSQPLSIRGFQSLLPGQKQWETGLVCIGFHWDSRFGAVSSHCCNVVPPPALSLPSKSSAGPWTMQCISVLCPQCLSHFNICLSWINAKGMKKTQVHKSLFVRKSYFQHLKRCLNWIVAPAKAGTSICTVELSNFLGHDQRSWAWDTSTDIPANVKPQCLIRSSPQNQLLDGGGRVLVDMVPYKP